MEENKINLLTHREKEILALMLQGYQNKDISERLFITNHTVKVHLAKIYEKFGVKNRVQATIYILNNHLDKEL